MALQNRYSILQKTLHELLFCDKLFYIFSFWRNNLRILRVKLPHVVAVKKITNPILNRTINCIFISFVICKVIRFFPLCFGSFHTSKALRRGMQSLYKNVYMIIQNSSYYNQHPKANIQSNNV